MIPHLSNHSNKQQSLSYIAIPGIFEGSVRPSSSYSLDSDPILSILTLVASEGESQGGETRGKGKTEGRGGEGRGKEGGGGRRGRGGERRREGEGREDSWNYSALKAHF